MHARRSRKTRRKLTSMPLFSYCFIPQMHWRWVVTDWVWLFFIAVSYPFIGWRQAFRHNKWTTMHLERHTAFLLFLRIKPPVVDLHSVGNYECVVNSQITPVQASDPCFAQHFSDRLHNALIACKGSVQYYSLTWACLKSRNILVTF